MNTILTKEIQEEITLLPNTEHAYIELYTTIKGITVYNGTIWGIQQIKLNEDGVVSAKINGDNTAILLHNIRDIQIMNTTESVTQYILNIEYNI